MLVLWLSVLLAFNGGVGALPPAQSDRPRPEASPSEPSAQSTVVDVAGAAVAHAEQGDGPSESRTKDPVVAPDPPTPAVPAPSRHSASAQDAGPDRMPASRPWYRDVVGMTLGTVGLVGVGVGATLWGVAPGIAAEARAADRRSDFGEGLDRAMRLERAGIATLCIGAVFLAAGIVRVALVSRVRGTSPRAGRTGRVRMSAAPGGLSFSF